MESRDVSTDSTAFKWKALPQRKRRSRRIRKTKHSNVPWVYGKSTVSKKSGVGKKKRAGTQRHHRISTIEVEKIADLFKGLSTGACAKKQEQIDAAALTGFFAGLKLGSQRK